MSKIIASAAIRGAHVLVKKTEEMLERTIAEKGGTSPYRKDLPPPNIKEDEREQDKGKQIVLGTPYLIIFGSLILCHLSKQDTSGVFSPSNSLSGL